MKAFVGYTIEGLEAEERILALIDRLVAWDITADATTAPYSAVATIDEDDDVEFVRKLNFAVNLTEGGTRHHVIYCRYPGMKENLEQ